jgi:hypothetical protein
VASFVFSNYQKCGGGGGDDRDRNVIQKEAEKKLKYKSLSMEIQ